jgi:hypothetical protein
MAKVTTKIEQAAAKEAYRLDMLITQTENEVSAGVELLEQLRASRDALKVDSARPRTSRRGRSTPAS